MSQPSGMGTAGIVAVPIPDGGAENEVLSKSTSADYDMEWTVVAFISDLEFMAYFLGE